jgi:hypothetical protein
MGKKITIVIAFGVSFVLLDIFSRFLYSQSWFGTTTFSKEVNPFDIIVLVVTSLVTIWLGWYVSKRITEQRYQKEYLINDLKEIEEEINTIQRGILSSSTLEIQTLIGFLNKLRTYMDRFSKTIEVFEISSINTKELNNQYNTLFQKATDLDGTHLVIDEIVLNELNSVCVEFVIRTRRMIFKVNNL